VEEEYGHEESVWMYECNGCHQMFDTEDEVCAHIEEQIYNDILTCGGYTMVPSDSFWVVDGKHWVVDTPAQEEVGHWEDEYISRSVWVYQCNGCGQIFDTEDGAADHNLTECFEGNYTCGSYTMVGGEPYKEYTGNKFWVVDTPAQEEIGHWEYR